MTSEDDFQAALDANPDDWQTRLVFADWLQDRSDLRAEGYRALGTLHLFPDTNWDGWAYWGLGHGGLYYLNYLPPEWYKVMRRAGYDSRREAEDAATRDFAKLSEECQAEIRRY